MSGSTYSLASVAEELNLSQGTVKRLAHLLGIPLQANRQIVSDRYTDDEIETLKTAQALLSSGKSLQQVRALVHAAMPHRGQNLSVSRPVLQEAASSQAAALETYESQHLKAQAASETMTTYRAQRPANSHSTLRALAEAINRIQDLPANKNTLEEAQAHLGRESGMVTPQTFFTPQGGTPSWMSQELRRQAVLLKRQLVSIPS